MPFISVVVPVHDTAGYLRQCLDSILGQPFKDIELIAIDDASRDHSPQILDQYAERDQRVRVIHLESNVGAGPAREHGLGEATGEYVWFVDADDWLAPGALRATANTLRHGGPDLLVVDHTRVTWLGEHRPGSDPPGGPAIAWNTVARRDLLLRPSARAGPPRITAMRRVCYHRRERRDQASAASSGRRTVHSILNFAATVTRGVRTAFGIALYHLMRLAPLDPRLAVYAAYWDHGYACNPAAVYEKARQLAPHVRGVWTVDSGHTGNMPAGVPFVVAGSLRYYWTLARARWLINNVNFPGFVAKRRGTVHLQTHHGTPVKVMGLEQNAFPIGAQGLEMDSLMRRSDRWDFSLSSNAHSTEVWSRSYPCRYETLEFGYPRNDRLALAGPADVAAARELLDIPDGTLAVLYAPTHREYVTGFQPLLDIEAFADSLGPDVLVFVRAHYFYPSSFPAASFSPASFPPASVSPASVSAGPFSAGSGVSRPKVRDVSAHPCVEDLLVAADVLVTDYSSMMFDYGVLDRPIVVYAPDWDTYVRTRGVTFDLLAEPPGVVAVTEAGLVDAFHTGAVWGDAATKARAQFRSRFCYLDDGHAAERVARHLFPLP